MSSITPELLLIQKFIFLLDEFHYGEFIGHLKKSEGSLPIKLSETIRSTLPEFDTTEVLCKKIYNKGGKAARLNLNQLSSYTFRLSNILVTNYPNYLHHNITKLQKLINDGTQDEAFLLADILLDMSERIEDFQCQIMVLKFLSQRAFLNREYSTGIRLRAQLEVVLETEKTYAGLESAFRKDTYRTEAATMPEELEKRKAFYHTFHNHPSAAIRIFSRFASVNCSYQYDTKQFESGDDAAKVLALQKDIKTYCYIVFPFMTDIKGNVDYLALNSFIYLASDDGGKGIEELSDYYEEVKFWKSYMNVGLINVLAVSTSRFLTKYHCYVHRSNYFEIITPHDFKTMNKLTKKCEELLSHEFADKKFDYGVRTVRMIYGVLLVLSGGESVKKGIDELESLLISYQQINMQSSTGSIFFGLMAGYFALKDYRKCALTFKRFQRISKGKSMYEGNKTKIYAYYFLSQWLLKGSKMYPLKMTALLLPFEKVPGLPRTIMTLIHHFNMPVDFVYDPSELI